MGVLRHRLSRTAAAMTLCRGEQASILPESGHRPAISFSASVALLLLPFSRRSGREVPHHQQQDTDADKGNNALNGTGLGQVHGE